MGRFRNERGAPGSAGAAGATGAPGPSGTAGVASQTVTNSDTGFTSTSYADPAHAGPAVTATTGTSVLILFSAIVANTTAVGWTINVAVQVSGATTIAAADSNGASGLGAEGAADIGGGIYVQRMFVLSGLTPGSNTFTLKYKVNGQTWTIATRDLVVIPL